MDIQLNCYDVIQVLQVKDNNKDIQITEEKDGWQHIYCREPHSTQHKRRCQPSDLGSSPTRHQHRDVIPIEEDSVQLRDSFAFTCLLVLYHILQHHVDVVVEAHQRAHNLILV